MVDACAKKTTVDGKKVKSSLKVPHWTAVMTAAMAKHCIGEVQTLSDRKGPRLVLHLPKSSDRESVRVYHNRLMALCGLTFAAFSKRLVEVASKGGGSGAREAQSSQMKKSVEAVADPGPIEVGIKREVKQEVKTEEAGQPARGSTAAKPRAASKSSRPTAAKSRAVPKARRAGEPVAKVGRPTAAKSTKAPKARKDGDAAALFQVGSGSDEDCVLIEASEPSTRSRQAQPDQGSKRRRSDDQLGGWHC